MLIEDVQRFINIFSSVFCFFLKLSLFYMPLIGYFNSTRYHVAGKGIHFFRNFVKFNKKVLFLYLAQIFWITHICKQLSWNLLKYAFFELLFRFLNFHIKLKSLKHICVSSKHFSMWIDFRWRCCYFWTKFKDVHRWVL